MLLVERMNGLGNGTGATVEERTAFQRAATLLAEFRDLGVASWVQQSGSAGRYELILSHYSPDHITEVQELLRLLELKGDAARESVIRIPVAVGVGAADFDGLAVQTRSVAEIMLTAAASIEVPREHVDAGLVEASADSPGALGVRPILKIHSSRTRRIEPTSPCSIAAGGFMWTTRTWPASGCSSGSRPSSSPGFPRPPAEHRPRHS